VNDLAPVVVKVGGSLFDWPELGPRLRQFIATLAPRPVLLVPGGGSLTEAIREWDATHGLGEEASHWMALRTLTTSAALLEVLVPGAEVIDPFRFAREDEAHVGRLPHSWDATSDSFAARIAVVRGASRLILLKSADPPEQWWRAPGYVDLLFERVIAGANFAIEAVNLSAWE